MTLCASEILDRPATTEITRLPLLAPDDTPLAAARQAAEEERLEAAAAALTAAGQPLTSRALAEKARISPSYRLHLAPNAPHGQHSARCAVIRHARRCL